MRLGSVSRGAVRAVAATVLLWVAAAGCSAAPAARRLPVGGHLTVIGSLGCSTATAPARELPAAWTLSPVPGYPFAVVVTPDGHWAFVSDLGTRVGNRIGVFHITGSGRLALVRTIKMPGQGVFAVGASLTPDGRYLLVADEHSGAEVIDVSRAERGTPDPVLGTLSAPAGFGAIEVAVSSDGRYLFVSLEAHAEIAVFRLRQALEHSFGPSDYVGAIPVGSGPVGLAMAPSGRWLYATSEQASDSSSSPQGTLSVISVQRAETDPARSVETTVTAGCNPVRVITSADGRIVWVTARESNMLLGFSAARLLSKPGRALVARVRVGAAPVGVALVRNGSRLVVADSNRFNARGARSSLAVISVARALAGKPALLGYLRAGAFPRQMALEPGGQALLVTNFMSRQLEMVQLAHLP